MIDDSVFEYKSLALWWRALCKANDMSHRVCVNTDEDFHRLVYGPVKSQRCKTYLCHGILDHDSPVLCKACRTQIDMGYY